MKAQYIKTDLHISYVVWKSTGYISCFLHLRTQVFETPENFFYI